MVERRWWRRRYVRHRAVSHKSVALVTASPSRRSNVKTSLSCVPAPDSFAYDIVVEIVRMVEGTSHAHGAIGNA